MLRYWTNLNRPLFQRLRDYYTVRTEFNAMFNVNLYMWVSEMLTMHVVISLRYSTRSFHFWNLRNLSDDLDFIHKMNFVGKSNQLYWSCIQSDLNCLATSSILSFVIPFLFFFDISWIFESSFNVLLNGMSPFIFRLPWFLFCCYESGILQHFSKEMR